jgi:hypothetical protein
MRQVPLPETIPFGIVGTTAPPTACCHDFDLPGARTWPRRARDLPRPKHSPPVELCVAVSPAFVRAHAQRR